MIFKDNEIKVYIASPYTNGWMPTMVKLQLDAAQELMDEGYFPYAPLVNHFQQIYSNRTGHQWLELDFAFLKVCDCVLRLKPVDEAGNEIPSSGADEEVELAKEEGIPVFYSIEEINDFYKKNAKQKKLFSE